MIYKFFFTETVETIHIEEETNRQPHLPQARITYEYPKKSFRFPIIPDEEVDGTFTQYEEKRLKERDKHQTSHSLKLSHKLEKKPFTPSQVASPIYGYQDRKKNKEIEHVPTYIRREIRQENEKERQKISNEKNIEEKAITNAEPRQTSYISKTNSGIHESKNDCKQESEYDHKQARECTHTLSQATNRVRDNEHEQSLEVDKSKNNQTSNNKYVKPSKKQNLCHKSAKRNHDKRPIPYNVIMTPFDKQKLKKRTDDKRRYKIPIRLLNEPKQISMEDKQWLRQQKELLEKTLNHFNVKASVVNATQGPTVTRFEVKPELGVKVSRIRNLSDDIKLNMAAEDIRIEAPIPGKNTVGIEVPNLNVQTVGLQEIFSTKAFKHSKDPLTIGLGLNIERDPIITSISNMPHGLIAGATGSGKSVCINTILISLLYKESYENLKLLLIDPKMVELAPYNGIPHLVSPVITDVKAATAALKWAVSEMENRYEKFAQASVRNIHRYNEKIEAQNKEDEKMPFIVIVIDELSDLMMASPQDVEDAICRIAQKARACGIHLLVATQRPSVDVITGLIKANIPTRIAFSVSSQVDSRTIIDMNGAERLLGKGDMLFLENGSGKSVRLQGAFVSDEEIDRVTQYVRQLAQPNYLFAQEELLKKVDVSEEDELLDEVIQFICEQNSVSTSMLQRQFRIGYNRARRLIDTLEERGIVSSQKGSKPRDVLISQAQLNE